MHITKNFGNEHPIVVTGLQMKKIKELKCKGEEVYNSDKELLDGEIWNELPGIKIYEISTFGRVKINKKLLKQADATGKTGYLVLVKPNEKTKVNTSTFVYTLVAKTFIGFMEILKDFVRFV